MKLAVLTVVVLAVFANELVLGVLKEQDAMKATSLAPVTWQETLANFLAPVLELLYIIVLPLAFIALLCALCVFASAWALVLVLMLLIAAAGRMLRH
jgi:hypothetical protein